MHGFLERVDGIDWAKKTIMGIRNNRYDAEVPTVTGPVKRRGPVHSDEARFTRAHTAKKLKFTLPGPMTICDTIADAHYGRRADMAMAFARALNEEVRELEALGVDVIQLDEPAFNVFMDEVKEWGIAAVEEALKGLSCKTAVHICYGYGIDANVKWKQTLGSEWRQYEEIFPAINKSRIASGVARMRRVQGADVADRAPEGQGDHGRRHRCGDQRGGDARGCGVRAQGGDEVREPQPDLRLHQLRDGAAAARGCRGQAEVAGGRRGHAPQGDERGQVSGHA